MNEYLNRMIVNFKGKDFKNFAKYVYNTLQKEIDVSKGQDKNKYIKIRNSIFNYIFSNEKIIVSKLGRKDK